MSEPALAPELEATIEAAIAELDRSIMEAKLNDDPLRLPLSALAQFLRAQRRLYVDATLTLAEQIKESKRTFADDEINRVANRLVQQVNMQIQRTAMQRTIGGICVGALILFALCAGSYFYGQRAYEQQQAGLLGWGRALQEACADRGAIVDGVCHAAIPVTQK
jgi:hypothetical protein